MGSTRRTILDQFSFVSFLWLAICMAVNPYVSGTQAFPFFLALMVGGVAVNVAVVLYRIDKL